MKVIRWQAVKEKVGLSRSTIWRLERAGKFPKHFNIGPNSIGWLESEVDAFIREAKDSE